MRKHSKIVLVTFCLCSFAYLESSWAARPFNTDDANIVPKNHCQVETWFEAHRNKATEIWALPACNFFWNTEISLGGMIGLQTSAFQFQIKTLFVDTSEKGWGIGMALGNIYNYLVGANSGNDIYFYIPVTVELWDARIIWHANVGYNVQSFRDSIWTLGVGLELAILPDNIYFVGEIYYVRFDPILYQVGLRTWLIKDILQIDATYGNNFSGRNDFVSLGFRILSKKLL